MNSPSPDLEKTPEWTPGSNSLVPDIRSQKLRIHLGELDPRKTYQLYIQIGSMSSAPIQKTVRGGQMVDIGHISLLGTGVLLSAQDISDSKNPVTPYTVDKSNIPHPSIDENLAIALAHNNANYVGMTGMEGYQSSEAVLYAAYLQNPRRMEDFAPHGSMYSRQAFDNIGFWQKWKLMKKIKKALKDIDSCGGLGVALEQAFCGGSECVWRTREKAKGGMNKALGTDQAPWVGKQFNFFSIVKNGNEAPQVNNTKIFWIGKAHVNTPNDPPKGQKKS